MESLTSATDPIRAGTALTDSAVFPPNPKVPLVTAFGLNWTLAASEWLSSPTRPTKPHMYGRRWRRSSRRVADFYRLPGFYALIWRGQPVYFGIAPKSGVGYRIREHLADKPRKEWDAFSWFGYGSLVVGKGGVEMPSTDELAPILQRRSVRDFEYVIRLVFKPRLMKGRPGFKAGDVEWEQVPRAEVKELLAKQAGSDPNARPGDNRRQSGDRRRLSA
jgi:hypothetical protein